VEFVEPIKRAGAGENSRNNRSSWPGEFGENSAAPTGRIREKTDQRTMSGPRMATRSASHPEGGKTTDRPTPAPMQRRRTSGLIAAIFAQFPYGQRARGRGAVAGFLRVFPVSTANAHGGRGIFSAVRAGGSLPSVGTALFPEQYAGGIFPTVRARGRSASGHIRPTRKNKTAKRFFHGISYD